MHGNKGMCALANAKQRIQNKRDWLAQQEKEKERKKDEKEKTVGKSSNRVSPSLRFIFFSPILFLLVIIYSFLALVSLNESVPLFKDQSLNKLPTHRKAMALSRRTSDKGENKSNVNNTSREKKNILY